MSKASVSVNASKYKMYDRMEVVKAPSNQQTKKQIVVAISGGAGKIAYSGLIARLSGKSIKDGTTMNIRLLDIPSEPSEKGLIMAGMELLDCGSEHISAIALTTNPKLAFKNADYVILLGGMPRLKGMERKDLIEKNTKIFTQQGEILNQVASKTAKILVVANPANTNAAVLHKSAPNIPAENISALTRLDHNRLVGQVASHFSISTSSVGNVCILGNHSDTQIPLLTSLTIDGEKADNISADENLDASLEKIIPLVQKRGAAVIKARGGESSAASAGAAAFDHMYDWANGSNGKVVSMAVPAPQNNPYGVPKDIVFSFPVTINKDGKYKVQDFPLRKGKGKEAEAVKINIAALQEELTIANSIK
jgi:malate dehydrogenase